jgi:hypothetical protein
MVNSCVNPACRTQFRLLHSGDLYVIERPATATGLFWICSDCASSFRPYLNADEKTAPRSVLPNSRPPCASWLTPGDTCPGVTMFPRAWAR